MDDLTGKISELLQNPAIASLLSQFGAPQGETPEAQPESAPPAPPPSVPQASAQGNPLSGLGLDGDMLQTVMKLAPLLSSLNQEDDSTRFLHALRPMLSNERQTKLDQASAPAGHGCSLSCAAKASFSPGGIPPPSPAAQPPDGNGTPHAASVSRRSVQRLPSVHPEGATGEGAIGRPIPFLCARFLRAVPTGRFLRCL